ncbi:MarR family transcriptional regulator [Tessaracoccus sp. HDW20]|uniref:MarR family transcriptional regulator n=1 Tax=Tessaracoccus coleopterorum TaxID=2714950 RepID=UPI0018D2BA9D|nr:MarR family transcriptional regulator [Tessaracoccus coleopterorum]NHB85022.1 MarR family transcriptional regulator [Tessaracoccus coleopterorum]
MTVEPGSGRMTQSSVRAANLALVLSRIPGGTGTISRADIAAEVGMTRSTVSRLVDDLITGRLVHEGETTPGARGRPAVPLSLQGAPSSASAWRPMSSGWSHRSST